MFKKILPPFKKTAFLTLLVSLSFGAQAQAAPAFELVSAGDSMHVMSVAAFSEPGQTAIEVKNLPTPVYPKSLIKKGVEGKIRVRVTVGTDGHVTEAKIISSDSIRVLALRKNVLTAVRSATFIPSSINGVPVEATLTIPYLFRIANPEGA